MARASARSFSQYSGVQRQKDMQYMPSTTERLQDPARYGAGTYARQALESPAYSWSLPLSERPAQAVGRSWYDPSRQAERVVRGTARQGQLQGAMILDQLQPPPDQFQQIMADQVQQDMGDTKNYGNAQGQGPLRNYMGRSPSSWGRNTVTNSMFRKPSYSF
jgi:hypothetical protein